MLRERHSFEDFFEFTGGPLPSEHKLAQRRGVHHATGDVSLQQSAPEHASKVLDVLDPALGAVVSRVLDATIDNC
ncbi:MAG TPA: hypothetical protein VJJ78_03860 [Candidatus Saccharimonadales bacterium]|nr:hypothetical protein [Candidatus Saccharimonadales bacterium]